VAITVAVAVAVGLTSWLVSGPATGLAFGLAGGLAFGLGLETKVDVERAPNPRSVLVEDRRAALTCGVLLGFGAGAATGLAVGPAAGLASAFVYGTAIALAGAWGRWCVARGWLACRGQLPPRLMAFLLDAHDRGVLRQVGAVWQFRHANLQRHLASRP
jgi:hypothetical protein